MEKDNGFWKVVAGVAMVAAAAVGIALLIKKIRGKQLSFTLACTDVDDSCCDDELCECDEECYCCTDDCCSDDCCSDDCRSDDCR